MILKDNRELKAHYDQLNSGDIYIGTVSSKHLKQTILLDLLERGVACFPSALSQVLNSSKVAQAFLLKKWMLPQTTVIKRRMDLMDAISRYNSHGIRAVITKQDHLHCGHGVRRWEDIELLYNQLGFDETSYPLVLQPYVESFKDIRVIIVDTYVESYIRHNPFNFRMNIAVGATSRPHTLDPGQERFCRSAMTRGKFPFAHLDLLVLSSGEYYLSEISLNGGTKGASISRNELYQKKQTFLENLAQKRRSNW